MKIKVKEISYDKIADLPERKHHNPVRPSCFFRWLLKTLSAGELKQVGFQYRQFGMERLSKNQPCLVLMNHSSFIDLKIAETVLYPRPLNIICTSDGFVGKEWLMRQAGCIPTNKFVTDVQMVRDMHYALHTLHSSVLMYPEASYSFDGTATPLPDTLGKCIKLLKVPVIMIRTHGAFLRDPLYNNLQLRNVPVSADVTYLLSPEEIEEKTTRQLQQTIEQVFTFDNFKEQQEEKTAVTESFRADYLNRVLYKCPHCGTEGEMSGRGILLQCGHCNKEYELDEYGYLKAKDGNSAFIYIPDWYRWQRDEVIKEIEDGKYHLDIDVDICIMKNLQCIYRVGEGRLRHSENGFRLDGCNGKLHYTQQPNVSYSLYADYYWYELGDVICIGDMNILYYCFPKNAKKSIVAKARIATEELYKRARKK